MEIYDSSTASDELREALVGPAMLIHELVWLVAADDGELRAINHTGEWISDEDARRLGGDLERIAADLLAVVRRAGLANGFDRALLHLNHLNGVLEGCEPSARRRLRSHARPYEAVVRGGLGRWESYTPTASL